MHIIREIGKIEPTNNVAIVIASGDPRSGDGLALGVGSLAYDTDGNEYRKTDTGDTDWVKIVDATAGGAPTIASGESITSDGEDYAGTSSYQPVGPDLNLAAAAGNVANNPKFLAAVMGNVLGDTLTKEGAYIAGVIGALSVLGAKASLWQVAGLIGIIMDGVSAADAAVVALIDGSDPSSVTRATAAFAARMNNNNAGSGVDYGVDLYDAGRGATALTDGLALAIAKAMLRGPHEICVLDCAGAPDGTTGQTFAEKGSLAIDRTTPDLYINVGSKASPSWKKFTRAA